tara:strand:- start:508 stop:1035 length:528 start_codon:yes stop_codon:yes gene_type:complete
MAVKIKLLIRGKEIEKILLNARKTIDGNIIVFDHPDMDILILPAKNKIVALPKEELDDELHDGQRRLFKYLTKKGVVDYSTVQAGNLFMSMEATIPDVDGEGDKIQYCLYALSKFIEDELPFYKNQEEYKKEMEKDLLQPEVDEYTEFDPARQGDTKGSMPPRNISYGIHSIYRI